MPTVAKRKHHQCRFHVNANFDINVQVKLYIGIYIYTYQIIKYMFQMLLSVQSSNSERCTQNSLMLWQTAYRTSSLKWDSNLASQWNKFCNLGCSTTHHYRQTGKCCGNGTNGTSGKEKPP